MIEEEREVEAEPEREEYRRETESGVGERDVGGEPESGAEWDGDTWQQLLSGDDPVGESEGGDRGVSMEARQFEGVMRRRVWDGEKWIEKEARKPHGVLPGRCLSKERGAPVVN